MSLLRSILTSLVFFGVLSSVANDLQVTSKEVFDRADKVVNKADSFLKRSALVLALYKNSVENFTTANTGVASLAASTVQYYDSLKKRYDELPALIAKDVEFAPIATFLQGLVKLVESFVPLSDYLDKGQRLLVATNKISDVLTKRIAAELVEANNDLVTAEKEKKKIDDVLADVKAKLAMLREAVASFEAAEKAAQSTGGLPVPPELIARRDKALADKNKTLVDANTQLQEAEKLLITVDGILQKIESTAQPMNDISKSVLALQVDSQAKLTALVAIMQKSSDEYSAKAEEYLKMVNGYTAWLNKGSLGVVPGIIEISGINTKKKELKPLPLFGEEPVKAYEKFAETFMLQPEAGKTVDVYTKDAAYLKAQFPSVSAALKGLIGEATALPGRAKQVIDENLNTVKKLQPIDLTFKGELFETQPFENYRIFDIQSGTARCIARYVAMPSFAIDLGLVKFTGLSMLSSNCTFMKISDLKDQEILNDLGEQSIRPGSIFKTAMSFTDRFITLIQNISVVKDIFTRDSMKVSGVFKIDKKKVASQAYIGTKLQADITRSVDFTVEDTKIGTLKLMSLGVDIVPGLLPNTANLMLPVKGTFDFSLLSNFPTLEIAMVYDVQNLAGTLSGIFKGMWRDVFNIKGLNFSDPGLSITLSKAGITGAGVTANMAIAGKTVGMKGNVDFTNIKQPEIGFIGTFEGGLSLSDLALMHAELAKSAGLVPFSLDDIKKYIPNLSLRECKVILMPKPMALFGVTYPAGTTVSGKAKLLGKEGEVFLNITASGIAGSFSIDPVDLKVIKMEGLGADKKLKFSISLKTADPTLAGLSCDANISLVAITPFPGFTAKGTVYLAPSLIRVTGLQTSLAGVGNVSLDVQAGFDLNTLPTNLASIPYKFKAVLKPDSIKSLSDSFQGAFNKMGECFK
jgi:hypothetical protein